MTTSKWHALGNASHPLQKIKGIKYFEPDLYKGPHKDFNKQYKQSSEHIQTMMEGVVMEVTLSRFPNFISERDIALTFQNYSSKNVVSNRSTVLVSSNIF